MHHLKHATGLARQLLARVLAELATADLGEDLILLATDVLVWANNSEHKA